MLNYGPTMRTFLVLLILVGVVFGLMWIATVDDRENNKHVNEDIFAAFRAIEQQCLEEQFPHETVRCQKVLAFFEGCLRSDWCSAAETYDAYYTAGFDLPSFYIEGYVPK